MFSNDIHKVMMEMPFKGSRKIRIDLFPRYSKAKMKEAKN